MKKVLIIDDNRSSSILADFLTHWGYCPIIVETVDEGLEKINEPKNLKVVLLNVESSGKDGLDALRRIKREHPEVIVIVIRAGVRAARRAPRLGAMKVLPKRIDMEHVHQVLGEAFGRLSTRGKTAEIPELDEEMFKDQRPLVGESKVMFELNEAIGLVANRRVSVLLEGETGTGKELTARLIHEHSERKKKAFIPINCGAITEELRESELLGYERGAFTDARSEGKKGLFELAHEGTLFLDEVGNMTLALQETLLRVLEEGQAFRVGGTVPYKVNVRVVSATNKNLTKMIKQGEFREDLYYRLCGYHISLPPLRERGEDIGLLIRYFLRCINEENDKSVRGINEENNKSVHICERVMELFREYHWPGNVRELENCLKRAAIASPDGRILLNDLPSDIRTYRDDAEPKGSTQVIPSSETRVVESRDKNLFDLPVVAFCQLISDAKLEVTDSQINEWSVEFSNDGRERANQAKYKIDNWGVEWHTDWFPLPDLSDRIQKVIDEAISRLSNLRHSSEPIEEAEPVSIIGKTHTDSLAAVLHEVVKGHSGDIKKAARELRVTPETLERRLSLLTEDDGSRCACREPLRELKPVPHNEILRLLTEPVKFFILENLSRPAWRNKSPNGKRRAVHLALKVLSKRLHKDHGYIYFGGMTSAQIEWNIYRRAPYLYENHGKAAKALGVTVRTFRKCWPKSKPFPTHHTLFRE